MPIREVRRPAPVSLPVEPWNAAKLGDPCVAKQSPVPAPQHVRKLIRNTFAGEVDERDLKYMATVILQLADEIFELRARVADLEAKQAGKGLKG